MIHASEKIRKTWDKLLTSFKCTRKKMSPPPIKSSTKVTVHIYWANVAIADWPPQTQCHVPLKRFAYRMHRLQMRQWCARGGRYVSHLEHTVHSSLSRYCRFCALCRSEKSKRSCGNWTVPGSQKTAFKWDMVSRNTTVLNNTTCMGAQRLIHPSTMPQTEGERRERQISD